LEKPDDDQTGCTYTSQDIGYCYCDTDLCNETPASADSASMSCYECNSVEEDCTEDISGKQVRCSEEQDACFVGHETNLAGSQTWNRGCMSLGGLYVGCFEHSTEETAGEICFCDEKGCNKDLQTAGKYKINCFECNSAHEECSKTSGGELKAFDFGMEGVCYISHGILANGTEAYTRGGLPFSGIEEGCFQNQGTDGGICFCKTNGCNEFYEEENIF